MILKSIPKSDTKICSSLRINVRQALAFYLSRAHADAMAKEAKRKSKPVRKRFPVRQPRRAAASGAKKTTRGAEAASSVKASGAEAASGAKAANGAQAASGAQSASGASEPAARGSTADAAATKEKTKCFAFGIRPYIQKSKHAAFMKRVEVLRAQQKKWSPVAWTRAVRREVAQNWGGGAHGGRRLGSGRKASAESPRTTSPTKSPSSRPDGRAGGDSAASGAIVGAAAIAAGSEGNNADGPGVGDVVSAASGAAQADGTLSIVRAPSHLLTATCVTDCSTAHMRASCPGTENIPFAPQNVVNWIYQALGVTIETLQTHLGSNRFNAQGKLVDESQTPAKIGGQVVAFWGTEIGARRSNAMVAWDYDGDVAVFITPGTDFGAVWQKFSQRVQSLGAFALEHEPGFKYRLCPSAPLASDRLQELYHEARVENQGTSRSNLLKITGKKAASGANPKRPTGSNCIDIEVYSVAPGQRLNIRGTNTFSLSTSSLFPIVEGIFGPFRVPLPATPSALNCEYGSQWRREFVVKNVTRGRKSYKTLPADTLVLKSVWPNVQMHGCPNLLGGWCGAGVRESKNDVPWRFLTDGSAKSS